MSKQNTRDKAESSSGPSQRDLEADFLLNKHVFRTAAYSVAGFGLGLAASLLFFKHKATMSMFFAGTGAGYGIAGFTNDWSNYRRYRSWAQHQTQRVQRGGDVREGLRDFDGYVLNQYAQGQRNQDRSGQQRESHQRDEHRQDRSNQQRDDQRQDRSNQQRDDQRHERSGQDHKQERSQQRDEHRQDRSNQQRDDQRHERSGQDHKQERSQQRDDNKQEKGSQHKDDHRQDRGGQDQKQDKSQQNKGNQDQKKQDDKSDKDNQKKGDAHTQQGKQDGHSKEQPLNREAKEKQDVANQKQEKVQHPTPDKKKREEAQVYSQSNQGGQQGTDEHTRGEKGPQNSQIPPSQRDYTGGHSNQGVTSQQVHRGSPDNDKAGKPQGPGDKPVQKDNKGQAVNQALEGKVDLKGQNLQTFQSNPLPLGQAGPAHKIKTDSQEGRDQANNPDLDNTRRQIHGLEQDIRGQSVKEGNNIKVRESSETRAGFHNYKQGVAEQNTKNQVNAVIE